MSIITSNNAAMVLVDRSIVLQGYLKKMKTMKKKYFVLYSDSAEKSARLEYYDSEKKFKSRYGYPKRSIILKSCFHINRRLDTKHKFVISLYAKDGCFCIVYDTETEMNKWLKELLTLHRVKEAEGDKPRTNFEHVWQVQVQRKGLAEDKGIIGNYHLCLTDKSLTLVRTGPSTTIAGEPRMQMVEFLLNTIRRCGDSQCYFYMEFGRHSAIGAGELWMGTEDSLIAQNMHKTIINAMSTIVRQRDEFEPFTRNRSSSANEASKPIFMLQRRQTHVGGAKPFNFSPSESAVDVSSTASSVNTVIARADLHTNHLPSETQLSSMEHDETTNLTPSLATKCSLATINQQNSNPQKMHDQESGGAGSAMGRERCDSLPSRNRTSSETIPANLHNTSMPPPRSIPSLNRPHSMYNTQRHSQSHSPPIHHTSPLSPSTGCSESGGSSLSIDETDAHSTTPDEGNNFGMKYARRSGLVIPEENPDDCWFPENNTSKIPFIDESNGHGNLSLSIYQHQRGPPGKGSPGPPVYTEMYSPNGSSPGDHPMGSGYVTMSPGADFGRSLYTSSSGAQSRASSLAEEVVDGYVPIEPPHHHLQEDYVDTEQSNPHHTPSGMSSAASSCSITSGTPSTDSRLLEYQLDKVVSRFTPDDEDTSIVTRPIRAYSVGSRLEHNKRKLRVDLLTTEHNNARTRAFSVGARIKMPRVIQTAHLSNITKEAAANAANNNNSNNSYSSHKSNKSFSAPMLINKSQSSIDPMDDLMEIDYTDKNSGNTSTPIRMSKPVSVPIAKPYNGPSDMPPGRNKTPGYVEMKPSMPKLHHENNSTYNYYIEMKPAGITSSYQSNTSSSPKKTITSPKNIPNISAENRNNNYMDMSSRSMRINNQRVVYSPHGSSDDYLNMSPIGQNSKKSIDVDLPKTLSAPEDYMEMSWGKSSITNDGRGIGGNGNGSNNNILEKPASDEYIHFNLKDSAKETRLSSRPIAIKFNPNINKTVIGNVPSSFMKTQRDRCDSKDSGIVTPSGSQPSLFPLSPEGSNNLPKFPSQKDLDKCNFPRKCLVDGTSGPLRLSEDEPDNNRHLTSDNTSKILNIASYIEIPMHSSNAIPPVDKLSNEYADMSLCSKKTKTQQKQTSKVSDYVNCNSLTATLSKPITNKSSDTIPSRDYEIMNPSLIRKIPATIPDQQMLMTKVTTSPATSTKKSLLVTINSNPDKLVASTTTKASLVGFKPITTIDEQLMKYSSKDNSVCKSRYSTGTFSRQISEKIFPTSITPTTPTTTEQNDSSSAYEILQLRNENSIPFQGRILSRPNSVNSEKISSSLTSAASGNNLTRPNSANSDRLPTISSSSSSSTLCGSSSSSQTLCGSKCQSPLPISNRPQSFSEIDCSRSESIGIHHIHTTTTTSRPPSVSSERELHYASLDLPPSSSDKQITKLNTDATSTSVPVITATTITTLSSLLSSSNITPISFSTPPIVNVAAIKEKSKVSGDSSSSSPNANSCFGVSMCGGDGGGVVVGVTSGIGDTATTTTENNEQQAFTYAQIDFIRSENINATTSLNTADKQQPAITNQLQSPTQTTTIITTITTPIQTHQSQPVNNC